MNLKIKIKNKNYNIEILEEENQVRIKVEGKDFAFPILNNKSKQINVPKMDIPKRDFSEKEVRAPIAGTISEIFVKQGDIIKQGQKLFVLSAMKMENEVISEAQGRIQKILFKAKDEVKEEDIIIIFV